MTNYIENKCKNIKRDFTPKTFID